MKHARLLMLGAALVGAAMAARAQISTGSSLVKFPENYEQGVHYNTINRGNVREEMFTNADAVAAAKQGQPLPSGTVIVNEWYENGELTHYFIMEKRTGWGTEVSESARAGEWEFQDFLPNGAPKPGEDGSACKSCHRSQSNHDFVWTYERMSEAN